MQTMQQLRELPMTKRRNSNVLINANYKIVNVGLPDSDLIGRRFG
jgi:hypothetical protein